MRILNIHEKTVRIDAPIRNAVIDFSGMTASVVAIVTDVVRGGKPVVGYGFSSNGRYGQGCLLRERFIPRILGTSPEQLLDDAGENFDPFQIWDAMMTNEKPGGHGERCVAVGAIDMAVWDIVAKIEEKPLFALLAERFGDGVANPRVFVYAAGGYYSDGGIPSLIEEVRRNLERGYSVVKMKIGGADLDEDRRRVEAVLEILGDHQSLAVDANGRFDLQTAMIYGAALEDYDLFWYEEAGDPLDFELQSELARSYDRPLATGENLFSLQDATNLIRYGGMRPDVDWLQFDCALGYGLVEYLRIVDMLVDHGWSPQRCIPHGGHQLALNAAAGLGLGGNESYPDLFQPFGGFPDGINVEDGHVVLPELPGIGFEGKSDLRRELESLFG